MIRATLALAVCQTTAPRATDSVHNSASFENQNAHRQNSNGSVQPGGAGPRRTAARPTPAPAAR